MKKTTVTANLYRKNFRLNLVLDSGGVIAIGNTVVNDPTDLYREEPGTVTFDCNEGYSRYDKDILDSFDELLEEDISVTLYQCNGETYLEAYFKNEPYHYNVAYNDYIYRVEPQRHDSDPLVGRDNLGDSPTNLITNTVTQEARTMTDTEMLEIIEDGATPVMKIE